MAATGRVVMWHTCTVVGTSLPKVTDFSLDSAATVDTTAEDDDIYMVDHFARDILTTGSITSRDVDGWDGIATGAKGTDPNKKIVISGLDSDGTTDHVFTIINPMITSKPLTGPRGYGSYVINFQAVSSDGSTDPVSIA